MQETETMPEVSEDKLNELEFIEKEIDAKRQELEQLKVNIEDQKIELKKLPAREIEPQEVVIVEKQVKMTNEMRAKQQEMERQKAYDKQMVTGRFMNLRNPGQAVKLPYIKYADDPVKWWPMKHNGIYTIPRGFADQINDHYHTPRFIQKDGNFVPSDEVGENSQIAEVDKSNKKFAFVPTSFH